MTNQTNTLNIFAASIFAVAFVSVFLNTALVAAHTHSAKDISHSWFQTEDALPMIKTMENDKMGKMIHINIRTLPTIIDQDITYSWYGTEDALPSYDSNPSDKMAAKKNTEDKEAAIADSIDLSTWYESEDVLPVVK